MSKKDLLERLTRAPSDAPRTRREDDVAPGRTGEPVQTDRVGPRVVRRRRVEAQEEAITPTVVRRRTVVVSEDAPRPASETSGDANDQGSPRVERSETIRTGDAAMRRRRPSSAAPASQEAAQQESAASAGSSPAEAEAETARRDVAPEADRGEIASAAEAAPARSEASQAESQSSEPSEARPSAEAAEPTSQETRVAPQETAQASQAAGAQEPAREERSEAQQGKAQQDEAQAGARGQEGATSQPAAEAARPAATQPEGARAQARGATGRPGRSSEGTKAQLIAPPQQRGGGQKPKPPEARPQVTAPRSPEQGKPGAGKPAAGKPPEARTAEARPARPEAAAEAPASAQPQAPAARAEQPAPAEQGRERGREGQGREGRERPVSSNKAQVIRTPDGSPVASDRGGSERPGQDRPGPERRPLPESPRYPGLGPAVVRPPPGYDPTNPGAYRAKQEADRAAASPGRDRPSGPAGRRRVDGGPGQGDFRTPQPAPSPLGPSSDGPRRRGRGPAAAPRVMERPVRAKARRKPGVPKAASPQPKQQKRKIKIDNTISVGQLAHELGEKAPNVIRKLMTEFNMMASITQMLDMDTAMLVAAEFGYEVENVGFQEENYLESVSEAAEEEGVQPRPPVVTIMGHVDHGKTTLLDTIRKSRVAAGEAGGITQHIGAYQVETDNGTVTFIDTPGHAAFTAMRARGASVTDVVVLVVAADDGVQPQTVEAIHHAKAAGVPIVVAVNKMDKDGASMDPIMNRLAEHELVPEAWGGDTQYVPVSALKNEGIDGLLEAILLQAEVLALKANPDRFAEGIVLEAKMERGRGAVATVLVQKGTLHRGDHVVLGSAYGKVRAILDSKGGNIKDAAPSTPVELFGLSELPEVGDPMHAVKSEQNARALAENRAKQKREQEMASNSRPDLDALIRKGKAEDRVVFHMILKADVGGSLQALKGAIEQIAVPGAECKILSTGVGDVTESDVNLAAANGAQIIGFNVKFDAKARQAASQLGVEPEFYSVIYDVLDRVQRGLKGLLAPVYEQVRVGTVEVRILFKISKVGTVAGSYVLDGKIARNNHAKVMRNGSLIWEGKVASLRRFKDDVREVTAGHECGVSLDGFEDLEAGDLIEAYAEQLVEA